LPDAIVAATAITGGLRLLTLDQGMMQGLRGLGYEF
jgi:predicted nucleic acid-binding protein